MRFRAKITICMVWLLALAYGIGAGVLVSRSFSDALQREEDAAFHSYQMVANTLQAVNSVSIQTDTTALTRTLGQLTSQTSAGWAALRLRNGGEVLYSSGSGGGLDGALQEPASGVCTAQVYTDGSGGRYLVVSGVLDSDSGALQMDISYDISGLYASRARLQAASRRIFLLLALAGGALSWAAAYVLTNPLQGLSRAARRLAEGDLSYRAPCRSRDEIGRLAADFNVMAAKLEANVDELQDSVRRQEDFMGSFAHEMKTPMTSIIGYADLLRSQSLTPEEQMDAANYIFSEGRRLESLSRKLLDLLVLRKNEISMTEDSPARILAGTAQHLRPIYLKENIDLQYRCQPGTCRMDPDLVRSLVTNLMDNARKAMDGGGNIYLSSAMTEDGCVIKVYDNGRGIPPQALAHLTEAFYRVDKSRSRAQGGVGLGLALCNEIAALHGGELRFESRVGRGTCVTAVLRGGRA